MKPKDTYYRLYVNTDDGDQPYLGLFDTLDAARKAAILHGTPRGGHIAYVTVTNEIVQTFGKEL